MARFFTITFELEASEARSEKVKDTVHDYLKAQGATEVLITHAGESDVTEEDEERSTSRSRR